jgi:hypothetical protein
MDVRVELGLAEKRGREACSRRAAAPISQLPTCAERPETPSAFSKLSAMSTTVDRRTPIAMVFPMPEIARRTGIGSLAAP